VRVLDFSKVLAGPLCTQHLGDLGAEIIKVEPCRGGDDTRTWPPFQDGEGTIFLSVNRNKRSLAVDLKSPAGRDICLRLARGCDVVIESFAPGVAERLGIGYDALRAGNPAIVYCSVSGFGTQGPMRDGKGYDLIAQAFTGMVACTGAPGGPMARSPFSPVDQGTGLYAVIGIMAALLQRAATGAGTKIEVSLFDTAVGFLGYMLQGYWQTGRDPVPPGSSHESLCPYQVFETQDGPIILGVATDGMWRQFCALVGRSELGQDPRFATSAARVAHRAETVDLVAGLLQQKPRTAWLALLGAENIPCSPVHKLSEMARHEHTVQSGMLLRYRDARGQAAQGVTLPLRADGLRAGGGGPPPRLGEHTRDVLAECGYSAAECETFLRDNVVFAGLEAAGAGP
jgi:crotonobetainyl-CoA:carnitine CoA-transferase CaiB-like acyl-CoA transferase